MVKKVQRRKASIPKDESKADRFVRVVTPRVGKAVKAIDLIGFCGGAAYEHTSKQVEEITAALYGAIKRVVDKLAAKTEKGEGFAFKS